MESRDTAQDHTPCNGGYKKSPPLYEGNEPFTGLRGTLTGSGGKGALATHAAFTPGLGLVLP
jgi:hypothetical protein